MFNVSGILEGRAVSVKWQDGKLDGDMIAVTRTRIRAAQMEGQPVGPPTGPNTLSNHLSDPLSAFWLIRDVLDEIGSTSGSLPVAGNDEDENRIY